MRRWCWSRSGRGRRPRAIYSSNGRSKPAGIPVLPIVADMVDARSLERHRNAPESKSVSRRVQLENRARSGITPQEHDFNQREDHADWHEIPAGRESSRAVPQHAQTPAAQRIRRGLRPVRPRPSPDPFRFFPQPLRPARRSDSSRTARAKSRARWPRGRPAGSEIIIAKQAGTSSTASPIIMSQRSNRSHRYPNRTLMKMATM